MGGGVPCATFMLFDAMTMKPCDASCVRRKLYTDGVVPVPLPQVTTGNSGPFFVMSVGRNSVYDMLGPVLFVVVTASEPFFDGSAIGNMPNTVGPTGDIDVHVV